MGYEGVKAADEIVNGKDVKKLNDTGVIAVDNANVNDAEVKAITEAGK